MDYEWVTDKDMREATKVLLTKDFSNLEKQGERVKLLDKLFKVRFLDYCRWMSAEEAKQEAAACRRKRSRGEACDEKKAKKAKRSWSDIDETDTSSDSYSESETEYSSSNSESDSSGEDEQKEEQQSNDNSQSTSDVSVNAESTSQSDHNSISIKNKDRDNKLVVDKVGVGIDKETSFFYDSDDEAELDEILSW